MDNEETKLRKYQYYWNYLKEKGSMPIQVNEHGLSDATAHMKRIRKAITKEKYMDEEFKRKYPYARIEVKYDNEMSAYVFTLSNYLKFDNLIGDLNGTESSTKKD